MLLLLLMSMEYLINHLKGKEVIVRVSEANNFTATLLTEIIVNSDGSLQQTNTEISIAEYDVTGGMKAKIASAAVIASIGIDVFIAKGNTQHVLNACKGIKPTVGTHVHLPC